MNIFGRISPTYLDKKLYGLIIIDDYFIFTWVNVLRSMNELFLEFNFLAIWIKIKTSSDIKSIHNNNEGKF